MASIEIDADAVNRVVADAILSSGLGPHLRKMAEDHLKELHRDSYRNPVKSALEKEVWQIVGDVVRTEFKPKIEAIVREKMTDEIVAECATAAWNHLTQSIREHRY